MTSFMAFSPMASIAKQASCNSSSCLIPFSKLSNSSNICILSWLQRWSHSSFKLFSSSTSEKSSCSWFWMLTDLKKKPSKWAVSSIKKAASLYYLLIQSSLSCSMPITSLFSSFSVFIAYVTFFFAVSSLRISRQPPSTILWLWSAFALTLYIFSIRITASSLILDSYSRVCSWE